MADEHAPTAWAVLSDEIVSPTVCVSEESAERMADTCGGTVVPLYSRHPSFTLTADERTAIQWVLGEAKIDDRISVEATLRKLLARCATGSE